MLTPLSLLGIYLLIFGRIFGINKDTLPLEFVCFHADRPRDTSGAHPNAKLEKK